MIYRLEPGWQTRSMPTPSLAGRRWAAVLERPLAAAAALLVVYAALSLLMDPHGYLGADTGAKVATLEAMHRGGTSSPDVGYWAERWDPAGRVHPLHQTKHTADGSWVAVTTLPMLELARPLYALGGYRATLLLPMLGGLGCALAARALARRLGDPDGGTAFWMVGLGSPIVLYALDFWEHSLGVAAVVGAVVLLVDVVDGRPGWWRAPAAGALLGAAASLRTEAMVYALVTVGACCIVLLVRHRRLAQPLLTGVGAVAGFVVLWFANRALESSAGGVSRAERAGSAASSATTHAASRAGERLNEAAVTLLGVKGDSAGSWLIGLVLVLVLLGAVRADRRGDRSLTILCFGLVALVYLVAALSGFGFVPGLVAAFPLALGAVVVRPTGTRAVVLAIAVGALPLVWSFQYLGGAGPQWGGRYLLASSVLLGVVALVSLTSDGLVRQGLVALSVGVAVLAVAWMGVRTRSVDALFTDLEHVDADVLVVRDAFLLREGGPVVLDRHWLTARDEETFSLALDVARRSGALTVAVAELGAAAPPAASIPDGWVEVARTTSDLTGDTIGLVTYQLP